MTLDLRVGLQEACRRLSPIRPDYADLPIREGFNWSSCLRPVPFDLLYLVVFRSVRRPDADIDLLREHDDRAYAEAQSSGGLLHYYKGDADDRGACLSFCLWESRDLAVAASGGASHRAAAEITTGTYASYGLERYDVAKDEEGAILFQRIGGCAF